MSTDVDPGKPVVLVSGDFLLESIKPCKGKGMGKYLPGSAGSPSVETQTTPTDEAAAVLNVCADITNQEGWGKSLAGLLSSLWLLRV